MAINDFFGDKFCRFSIKGYGFSLGKMCKSNYISSYGKRNSQFFILFLGIKFF